MNELLQKHGCANVFHIPEGLRELMGDISREVLRAQPKQLLGFITNYLSVLLITREHGIMTVKILDDLCDCRPSVSDHLTEIGLDKDQVKYLTQVIHDEISCVKPTEGKEKVREIQIMKKILVKHPLDEEFSSKVIQVIRNAYRDYWYRKKVMQQAMKMRSDEPWQIAANNTLEIYKRTKPSMAELTRATQRIQVTLPDRGYYVRRKLLDHLKKPKKQGPKIGLGPPLDVAESREIDLGPVLNIKVKEDNIEEMFDKTRPKPSVRYTGPQAPSLLLDEEDDVSHHHTVDIMSTRTDDDQTLSRYGVAMEDSKSIDDDYGAGAGGPRISFASKPFMLGASDTSDNKDEVKIPEAIIVVRPESPASTVPSSTPVDDASGPDDTLPHDTLTDDASPGDAFVDDVVLEATLLDDAFSDEVKSETALLDDASQDDTKPVAAIPDDVPPDEIKSDAALAYDVPPGDSIPDATLPYDASPLDAKPGEVPSDDALLDDAPPDPVPPGDALPDDVALNDVKPDDVPANVEVSQIDEPTKPPDNDAFDDGNEADDED